MVNPKIATAVILTSGACFVVGWCIWAVAFQEGTLLEKFLLVLLVIAVLFSGFLLYGIRMCITIINYWVWTKGKTNPRLILQTHLYRSLVIPSDLNMVLKMTNSRYGRAADFARASFVGSSGFAACLFRNGGFHVVSTTAYRYRKPMKFLQRYTIKTKLVHLEDDALYMEQQFISKYKDIENFVYCSILTKMAIRGVTTGLIFKKMLDMDELPPLPEPSEQIRHFVEFNKHSSQALRN